MSKMKTARAKRAKLLFFIVKYANFRRSCCRRRRGCLSSILSMKRHFEATCLRFSLYMMLTHEILVFELQIETNF